MSHLKELSGTTVLKPFYKTEKDDLTGKETDAFYLPQWQLILLQEEDNKSHIVEQAITDYYEKQGKIPEQVMN